MTRLRRKKMKLDVYNKKGEKLKTPIDVSEDLFDRDLNENLLAQYVRVFQLNQRQGTSKTKTRGEVSGGGRKPWPQKGTGRARHGSIRSPLWVKGGTVFGPQPKNWGRKMPRKMRHAALCSAFSQKNKEGNLKIVKNLELDEIRTKTMAELVEAYREGEEKSNLLLVVPKEEEKIILSARNLPKVKVVSAGMVNAYDVLWAEQVVLTASAVEQLEEILV
ncbi:MAG: 50S ribosomal protein L4 [Patescibacteria group bacterium]